MRQLLEKLNREELLDFLAEYAENDAKFANAVDVRFGKPEFKAELGKIQSQIDIALGGSSDYRAHDSWGYYSFDASDITLEIQQRVTQGHIRLGYTSCIQFMTRQKTPPIWRKRQRKSC